MPQPGRSSRRRLTALLLDDHELLRRGLRTLLERQTTVTVVGEAPTIAIAVERVGILRPTLVITTATLRDGDAAEACRRIAAAAPGTRVAVLSDGAAQAATLAAARAGISGYLSAHMRAADLCRAIRAIATGDAPTDRWSIPAPGPWPRREAGRPDDPLVLTAQERRVLALVAEGKTNKEIGVALALSEKTVKNYLSNVFDKLQV
jgi:DNA-binding NarL/FixJ family response regulator